MKIACFQRKDIPKGGLETRPTACLSPSLLLSPARGERGKHKSPLPRQERVRVRVTALQQTFDGAQGKDKKSIFKGMTF
jgi:hypothetical protein